MGGLRGVAGGRHGHCVEPIQEVPQVVLQDVQVLHDLVKRGDDFPQGSPPCMVRIHRIGRYGSNGIWAGVEFSFPPLLLIQFDDLRFFGKLQVGVGVCAPINTSNSLSVRLANGLSRSTRLSNRSRRTILEAMTDHKSTSIHSLPGRR
jgi:hypothetical protein